MPPKKKKGGKKKKKKQDGELTTEDKYKKTLEEIQALKDHLFTRKEVARRSLTQGAEWKTKMEDARQNLEEFTHDQREVSADMTRQYKTMQTEMSMQVHQLRSDLARTQKQLEDVQETLKETISEKDRLCKEKDETITELTLQLETMGNQCQKIIHEALDGLVEKVAAGRSIWEKQSTDIQSSNKQTILAMGLHHLQF